MKREPFPYQTLILWLRILASILLLWIFFDPDPPKNVLFIVLLGIIYAEFFIGIGLFLVNSLLAAIVISTGNLSKLEKKWVKRHLLKIVFITALWAFTAVFFTTASADVRFNVVINTTMLILMVIYGNFYRDLDKLPADLRKMEKNLR